jgi:type II secretory pathway pseudopilin PulG
MAQVPIARPAQASAPREARLPGARHERLGEARATARSAPLQAGEEVEAMSRHRGALRGEAGMTLVELLVAAALSVVIVGAAGSMLISAVRSQPRISERARAISTARYVLERMTREIRNAYFVYEGATGSAVSIDTRVRSTTCGAPGAKEASEASTRCKVTYACSGAPTASCTRTETDPGTTGGTPATIVSGLESEQVFNYSPDAEEPTYIGMTLEIPNPEGSGNLTITDGAGLRTLELPQ